MAPEAGGAAAALIVLVQILLAMGTIGGAVGIATDIGTRRLQLKELSPGIQAS